MTRKKEHFSEQFNRWRLDNAKKEEAIFLTAIKINDYLESEPDLKKVKEDFQDASSPKYIEFECYKKREYGSLLYCKLIVQDYLQICGNSDPEETALLELIAKDIEGLYLNGRIDTQKKLDSLFGNCNSWLDNYAGNRPDVTQIKPLCYSIYILLKILDLSLKGLDSWSRKLASAFINLDALTIEIGHLLKKTEEKIISLEALAIINADDCSTTPKNMGEYLNQYYLQILETSTVSRHASLVEKVSLLETAVQSAEELSQLLKKREAIKLTIEHAKSLLISLYENEQKVIGRKYFLEIINDKDKCFNLLMEYIKDETKTSLFKKIEQLKNPNNYQKISSSMQYVASWVTLIPASALRLTASQTFQDTVVNVVPATLDSECKNELKVLADQALSDLNQDLSTVEQTIKECSHKLALEDEDYEKFIHMISSEMIDSLAVANKTMLDSVMEYKTLLKVALITQQKFKEIEYLNENIEEFLRLHDGFLVKLSNFFAKLCSFFKTKAATLVDNARDIQCQLRTLKEEYHTVFETACEGFKMGQEMPSSVERSLIQQSKAIINHLGNKTARNLCNQDIGQSFALIEQSFFSLKQGSTRNIGRPSEITDRRDNVMLPRVN